MDYYDKAERGKIDPTRYLSREDNIENDLALLRSVFEGLKGKRLRIAVSAAVKAGILDEAPPFNVMVECLGATGVHGGYDRKQEEFSDPAKMHNWKDRDYYHQIYDKLTKR